MANKTYIYSFEDTVCTINSPLVGAFEAYGTGLGSVSISYNGNISNIEVAADLAAVISKTPVKNGTVTISTVQSSELHDYLKNLTNTLVKEPARNFASTSIVISNKTTGANYYCEGCVPQKMPDDAFGSTAATRSWVFNVAYITAK